MIRGLQTGFGELVDPELLDQLEIFPRLRSTRVKVGPNEEVTVEILKQVSDRGWRPWLIVLDPDQIDWIPKYISCDVGLHNEPNIGTDTINRLPITPLEYRLMIAKAYGYIWSRQNEGQDIKLWVGCISNLTENPLGFLSEIMSAVPPSVGIDAHWYPHHTLRGPHPGYSSREQELASFLRIVRGHRWGISETGWHTAPERRSWWPWAEEQAWTNEEIAITAEQEFQWWEECGATYCILYQIMDGLKNTGLDRYGICDINRKFKPVSRIFL